MTTSAARLLAQVQLTPIRWEQTPDETHATHEGVLEIAGRSIRVYQLSDGQRVLDVEDVDRFFNPDLEDADAC